jgi:DNA polymerase elongation subunit (family B)
MDIQVIDWNDICVFPSYDDDEEYDDDNEKSIEYIIQIFGKTNNNESVCLNVHYFRPYIYIKNKGDVPPSIYNEFYHEFVSKKDYQKGFINEEKNNFIKLYFDNSFERNTYVKKYQDRFDFYESNVNGVIQFIHDRHLTGCSWISIPLNDLCTVVVKKSKCQFEYNVYDSSRITQIQERKNDIVKLKILSYDLEVISEDGSFPVATRKGDKIIQIGMTFNYFQEKTCFKKYLIQLGDCDKIKDTEIIECDSEVDVIKKFVHIIDTEDPDIICGYNIFGFDNKYLHDRSSMFRDKTISTMSRLFREQKYEIKELSSSALGDNIMYYYRTPGRIMIDLMKVVRNSFSLEKYSLDFVSSYFNQNNIHELTNSYFVTDVNDCLHEDSYCFIKIIDELSGTEQLLQQKLHITHISIDEKKNRMSVFFDNGACINDYEGSKLKWTLAKDDIHPSQITSFFHKDKYHRSLVGKYCIKDCELVNYIMEKLDVVSNSIAMANVCMVPLSYIFTRGQGIKAFSLIKYQANINDYLFPAIYKEKITNKKRVLSEWDKQNYDIIEYTKCVNENCQSNNDIFKKKNMLEVYENKYKNEVVCMQCNRVQYDTFYEGAHVKDPIPGYYTNPIVVMDFASLYPNSIIQKNMSGETQLIDPVYENVPGCQYFYASYKTKRNKIKNCCFVKKNNKLGIIPQTLNNLLEARKKIKSIMKKEKDLFKKRILDGQQLAMKVTANSIYGQMGAITSPIYMKDIAACTTSTGKEMLLMAENFMTKSFPEILKDKSYHTLLENHLCEFLDVFTSKYDICPICVYGDTDSVFVSMGIHTKKNNASVLDEKTEREWSIRLGQIAERLAEFHFPKPQNLEYEKVYHKWAIFCKKKYTGKLYESSIDKYYINNMGIVLKRRDNAKIVKKVCGTILHIMFHEEDYVSKCIDYVRQTIKDMHNNKFDQSYFVLSKTLKKSYKGKKLTNKKYKCNCGVIVGTKHSSACISRAKKGDIGTWDWDDVVCSIAHVNLCQRMKKRDPGSAPNPNDRISFVYIETSQKNCLQGDRIEELNYFTRNNSNIKIDFRHYIENQIKNPVIQFLELIIPNPEELFMNQKYDYGSSTQKKILHYFS